MKPVQRSRLHVRGYLQRLLLAGLIATALSGCGGALPGGPRPKVTQFEVTAVMYASDPNLDAPKPDGSLLTALERLQKAHGFHFVYNFNTTKLVGDATGLSGNYHYKLTTVDGKDTAISKIGEWLIVNDPNNPQPLTFLKEGSKWVQTDPGDADQTYPLIALTILSNAMSVSATPRNFPPAGSDTIDGQPADHYIKVNQSSNNSHEIWVSQTSGDVLQITETSQQGASTTDLNQTSVLFSNVNQPISIEAPR